MKKILLAGTILIIGLAGVTHQTLADEQVNSLRGDLALDDNSTEPEMKNWQLDRDPIERDHVKQPPLIPHKVQGYKINLKFNKCMSCHSWTKYKEAGATKISQSHFEDRENNVMANVAARRYFCNQCHVPQVDAKPLVENTFQSLPTVK
ncbi:MAG: nitrate reductase cytochrome c-type subunit [Proteobacteria bacterium]|nr:nitrate reductase cytochrome c-type subunit [Pseudomonadota bacterium]NOG61574.1 nitrate reductase cytochrome c-type subunit [Pseudomonadota bacterium]